MVDEDYPFVELIEDSLIESEKPSRKSKSKVKKVKYVTTSKGTTEVPIED